MDRPLVSVIMPAYNAERFVAQAVRSIQEQSYARWEMVCVDDCSTDGTYKVLLGLARDDGRIRVLRNDENLGCGAARNIALEHAQGELIALQDADDFSLRDRLERSLCLLRDADLVGSYAMAVDEAGRRIGMYRTGWDPRRTPAWDWLTQGRTLFPEATMVARREALPVPLCNPLFRVAVLYDMLLRMAAQGARFSRLDYPAYAARHRKDQVTNRLGYEAHFIKLVAQQGAFALREGRPFDYVEALARVQQDSAHVARAHLRAGWIALIRSDLGPARTHLSQAAQGSPTRSQALALHALSYVPGVLRGPVVSALIRALQMSPALARLGEHTPRPSRCPTEG